MIGGLGLPKRLKEVEGLGGKLVWIFLVAIGFFVVIIPNWLDTKIHRK